MLMGDGGRWCLHLCSAVWEQHARVCLCVPAFVRDCNSCWGGGKDFGGEPALCSVVSIVWSWRDANQCLQHLQFNFLQAAVEFTLHSFLCFLARVKWPSEATIPLSSATQAACTLNCGTLRTAKSSTTARTYQSQQPSDCPRRRRRGKNCRRRS